MIIDWFTIILCPIFYIKLHPFHPPAVKSAKACRICCLELRALAAANSKAVTPQRLRRGMYLESCQGMAGKSSTTNLYHTWNHWVKDEVTNKQTHGGHPVWWTFWSDSKVTKLEDTQILRWRSLKYLGRNLDAQRRIIWRNARNNHLPNFKMPRRIFSNLPLEGVWDLGPVGWTTQQDLKK